VQEFRAFLGNVKRVGGQVEVCAFNGWGELGKKKRQNDERMKRGTGTGELQTYPPRENYSSKGAGCPAPR